MEHFLTHLKLQVSQNPDQMVMTDHRGTTSYTYRTMVQQMAKIDSLLTALKIEAGDKVALCGRNSANWGIAFMTLMASRRIAVSILPDFTADGIAELVRHSQAKILFSGDLVWKSLVSTQTPQQLMESVPTLHAIISLIDFQPYALANEADSTLFLQDYASSLSAEQIAAAWPVDNLDDMCLINYTSGTTSSPKGVMLTYRSLSANVEQGLGLLKENPHGKKLVAILPMAHMYGLAIEYLAHVVYGAHVYFMTKTPTPIVLAEALNAVHPYILFCVPLVLEKVFRQKVLPIVKKPLMRVLLAIPGINIPLRRKIRNSIIAGMGGKIECFVVGGAALNQEVETWMHRLGLPYIVGYGMTECGPLIAASQAGTFDKFSCGRQLPGMEVRIDSENPHRIDGEILTRGANVMLGYYKNEEATRATITPDGWLRTGDLGVLNERGDLFIKGRSKNMILGPSGQNIYPEELEDRVNSIPGVVESVVIERAGHLIALIYADEAYARRLGGRENVEKSISNRLRRINQSLPMYSQIKQFEFVEQEFEKTPKRSIKRYLYK